MLTPIKPFTWDLFEDTLATLERLREQGTRMAILTNRLYPAMGEILSDYKLRDLVEIVLTSGEMGYRKPHPLLFEEALRRLDVPPDEAVMVGDSYENDVLGAQNAGIRAILKLNDREDCEDWRCEMKIRQLSELPSLLFS